MNAKERLEALKKAPPGGWVAFTEDEAKVVAYGNDYDQVVCEAERSGESELLLVKVPKDWTATVMAA